MEAAPPGRSSWEVNLISSSLEQTWTPDLVSRGFSIQADPGTRLAVVTVEVTALEGGTGQLAERLKPYAAELGPDVTTFLSGTMPEKWLKVNVFQIFAFPKGFDGRSQFFLSSKCPLKLDGGSQALPLAVHAKKSIILSVIQVPAFTDTDDPAMLLFRQEHLAAGWVYTNRKVEMTLVYAVSEHTSAGTFTFADAGSQALKFSARP